MMIVTHFLFSILQHLRGNTREFIDHLMGNIVKMYFCASKYFQVHRLKTNIIKLFNIKILK